MYTPPFSREDRVPVLQQAIEQIRFGTLITVGADGPLATHIPMFVQPQPGPMGVVFGHIARANGHWEKSDVSIPVLAVFVGPQAYITPSWYDTKKQTGKVVPTWQYLAVHARGPIRFIHDPAALHDIVHRSTLIQEGSREHPWALEDAPSDYIDRQLRAIVGFEISVSSIEGAWKLGQNKNEADRRGVIEGLEACEHATLAALVRESGPS
ncbi:MAG: FMN-binding negative transcriptional regulator [Candidatus Eremiobacteraeota bacterium]|nr:FMN-binding negative transcriptional regulator [Candidatus Eremiobacteraeota bacterium]